MSEWLKEHAWKLMPLARADAHQSPPTHFRSTTSRNIDTRLRVPVTEGVCLGFRGACDTVLTQCRSRLARTHIDEHQVIRRSRRHGGQSVDVVRGRRSAFALLYQNALPPGLRDWQLAGVWDLNHLRCRLADRDGRWNSQPSSRWRLSASRSIQTTGRCRRRCDQRS